MTMRFRRVLAVATAVLLGASALTTTAAATPVAAPATTPSAEPRGPRAAEPQLLSDDVAMYPRGVQLAHQGEADGTIVASVTTFTDRGGEAAIFRSTDEGGSFEQISSIPLSRHNGQDGLCCGTLFELPQGVGALPAGTLLYSASVGQDDGPDRRMDLDIWQSQDAGESWTYLSACAAAPNGGGLWEPEFSVDAQGRLVCHYADETDALDGTQNLVRVVSEDGVTWTDRTYTVRSTPEGTRPGMPVVRTLPDGRYVMVFEVCGRPGQYDCATYSRYSDDGWDWGDPLEHGEIVTSVRGRYFAHAPTVAVAEDGTPHGTLLIVGQLLREADGSSAPGNGSTIFVGRGGSPAWQEIPAPIAVPDAFNHWCPNYSSALVPLAGGRSFVELASDLGDDGVCRTSFARGAVRA
jgi:hypothetical protein